LGKYYLKDSKMHHPDIKFEEIGLVTDWIVTSKNPDYDGLYLRKVNDSILWAKFKSPYWLMGHNSREDAENEDSISYIQQAPFVPYCGLSKKMEV
jgi:hypothetical protein